MHWRKQEAAGRPVALFDEMGLGKTWTACARIREDDRGEGGAAGRVRRTLVVAPACVLHQWVDVVSRFGIGHAVRVVSYSAMGRRSKVYASVMGEGVWFRILLDEAQYLGQYRTDRAGSFVGSRRSKACHAVRATHRCALTGTPCYSTAKTYRAIAAFLRCTVDELRTEVSLRRRIGDLPDLAGCFPAVRAFVYDVRAHGFVEAHRRAVGAYVDRVLGPASEAVTPEAITARASRAPCHRRVGRELGSLSLDLIRKGPAGEGEEEGGYSGPRQPKVTVVCRLVRERPEHSILVFTTYTRENELLAAELRRRFPARPVHSVVGATPQAERNCVLGGRSGHYVCGGSRKMCLVATALLGRGAPLQGVPGVVRRILLAVPAVGRVVVAQLDCVAVGLNLGLFRTAIFPRPGWCVRQEHQAVCRMRRMEPGGAKYGRVEAHFMYTSCSSNKTGYAAGEEGEEEEEEPQPASQPHTSYIDVAIANARQSKKESADEMLGEDCAPWKKEDERKVCVTIGQNN